MCSSNKKRERKGNNTHNTQTAENEGRTFFLPSLSIPASSSAPQWKLGGRGKDERRLLTLSTCSFAANPAPFGPVLSYSSTAAPFPCWPCLLIIVQRSGTEVYYTERRERERERE